MLVGRYYIKCGSPKKTSVMAEIADHLFHDAGNHHAFVRCGSLWLLSNRILIRPFVHYLPLRMNRAPLYAFVPFVDGGVLFVVFGGFMCAARVIPKRKYDEGDVKISWPQLLYTLPHKHWIDTGMTAIPKKIYHGCKKPETGGDC